MTQLFVIKIKNPSPGDSKLDKTIFEGESIFLSSQSEYKKAKSIT